MNSRELNNLFMPELEKTAWEAELQILEALAKSGKLTKKLSERYLNIYQALIPPIELDLSSEDDKEKEKNDDDRPVKMAELDHAILFVVNEIERFYPHSDAGEKIAAARRRYRLEDRDHNNEEENAVIIGAVTNDDFIDDDAEYFYTLPMVNISVHSPRYRYLMHKLAVLSEQKALLRSREVEQLQIEADHQPPGRFMAFLSAIKKPFDISKKFIDLIDDIWNAVGRNALPAKTVEAVAPILVGIVGAILHAVEGAQGLWDTVKAIRKEKSRNRKTKIAVGLLSFMLGGAGFGLSISYIAFGAGAEVLGSAVMPVLIPALLGAIYAVQLWKLSYRLHTLKQREAKAEKALHDFNVNNVMKMASLSEKIRDLKEEKKLLEEANLAIQDKITAKSHTSEDLRELKANDTAISVLSKKIHTKSYKLTQLKNQQTRLENKYKKLHEKRLQAERDVAFKCIEITASMLVVTGVTLGAGALIGAGSVATFGALPIALLVTGVVIGIAVKVFEYIDERNDHKYSNAMRGWFVDKWNSVTSLFKSEPKPELGVQQQPKARHRRSRSEERNNESSPLLGERKPGYNTADIISALPDQQPATSKGVPRDALPVHIESPDSSPVVSAIEPIQRGVKVSKTGKFAARKSAIGHSKSCPDLSKLGNHDLAMNI